VDTRWLKGYTDTERRKKIVKGHKPALDDLRNVLEQHLKKKEAVRDYSSPGWEHEQIAVNEYNQALDDLIKLITIKE